MRALNTDAATAASARGFEVPAGEPATMPIVITSLAARPPATAEARAAQAPRPLDCEYASRSLGQRLTRIGEMHQNKTITATFTYGAQRHAETTFSTSVSSRSGSGPWEAGGSAAIRNSVSSSETFDPRAGRFSRYLRSRFAYRQLYLRGKDCGRKQYITQPSKYTGGSSYVGANDAPKGLDGRCASQPDDRNHPVAPGGKFTTEKTTEAKTFTLGVRIANATLSTQSGFSDNVITSWHNSAKAKRVEYLCAINAPVEDADVVYAG